MAVEQVAVQELPFTIEPLSPKRVQLWSRFAARATTEADMWIVRNVYYAFWWEVRIEETVQRVFVLSQHLGEQSDVGLVVGWLNSLAYEHVTLRDAYSEVLMHLAPYIGSSARYYKDVEERFGEVVDVLAAVRQYGIMLCSGVESRGA